MSANQKTRLFIALRELEKMLQRKDVTQEELTYGLGNLRVEVESTRRAMGEEIRETVPVRMAA